MTFALVTTLLSAGLFLGMLVLHEAGRRFGWSASKAAGEDKSTGVVEGAVFALLGLLLGFTFLGAATRFQDRRDLVTQETNAIGTAWLRLDLLPEDVQPEVRALFRTYMDSRLDTYRDLEDREVVEAGLVRTASLQIEIWNKSVAACRRPETPSNVAIVLLPALNDMFDIVTTRTMATENHPPTIIFWMLALLSLVCTFLAGNSAPPERRRYRLHAFLFAFALSITFFLILDLEYPRLGLIRMDSADRYMHQLRQGMD